VGDVLVPDEHLGLVVEQEPNDAASQAWPLPPLWPRCTLEVTGTLGTSAARYGRADPRDVLRLEVLREQAVSVLLTFGALDPESGLDCELSLTVRDAQTLAVLDSAAGPTPLEVDFDAAAGGRYDVDVEVTHGHTPWRLAVAAADPGGFSPKPSFGVVASGPAPTAAPARVVAPEPACCADHVLVRLDDDVDVEAFCREHRLRVVGRTGLGTWKLAAEGEVATESGARKLGTALSGIGGVLRAEPDWIVLPQGDAPDPEFARQWNLRAIGAPSAWDVTMGDPSVVIGFVDTGVVAHPDLAGRMVAGYDFVSALGYAADGNGRDPDPTDPGDEIYASGLSAWHGTHVAAIAIANQDDVGVTGVAPGCRGMALRALGRGGGLASDAADAILFAAGLLTTADGRRLDPPLRIANLSFGLSQDSAELRDACDRARNVGVLLVAAAGNTGGPTLFPAAYDSTFAVSAVDGDLAPTGYSNYGPEIQVVGPGGNANEDVWIDGWPDGILSAIYDETVAPRVLSQGFIVGTSQAAPHVAAVAALMLSVDPSLTLNDLIAFLRGSALDVGVPGDDLGTGRGLVQAHEALNLVLGNLGTPRADPPALYLPAPSVVFGGISIHKVLPLLNGGGGSLALSAAGAETDDGGAWLSASLLAADTPGGPISHNGVEIEVDRHVLGTSPGRHAGTVSIWNPSGVLGAVRVVVLVQERVRAGQLLQVAIRADPGGGVFGLATAWPNHSYRYWCRSQPAGAYRILGSEDVDGDGFFCEPGDSCGWYGGPSEADALVVDYDPDATAALGLNLTLRPP